MILASHYVIRDLLRVLESKDIATLRRLCDKYCMRYKNDTDFVMICNMIQDKVEEIDDNIFEDIRLKLNELSSIRKLDTSGGGNLWFEDRRRM